MMKHLQNITFKKGRNNLTIIGLYEPTIGRKEETEIIYNQKQDTVEKINKKDPIISGDLNARTGMQTIDDLIGPHGETNINENRVLLWDFCTYN